MDALGASDKSMVQQLSWLLELTQGTATRHAPSPHAMNNDSALPVSVHGYTRRP